MAGSLSKAELDAAREELNKTNERLGFRRSPQAAPSPVEGKGPEIESGKTEEAVPPAQPMPQTDPGPPRFIGVDIEHALIGLAGGAVIPLAESASGKIVDILLGELQLHLTRTLGAIAGTHKRSVDPAQIEIPFDAPRDQA